LRLDVVGEELVDQPVAELEALGIASPSEARYGVASEIYAKAAT
jgi:hypothetical protein